MIGILGLGAVGLQLLQRVQTSLPQIPIFVSGSDREKVPPQMKSQSAIRFCANGEKIEDQNISLLVLACSSGQHLQTTQRAIRRGISVISISNKVSDVTGLLKLEDDAKETGASLVIGASFSPGLTCALVDFASKELDYVDEIHIAKDGTGGPSCAKQHHRSMKRASIDWWDGKWVRRPGGSGRELIWFPEPIAGADCYRAALPDAIILKPLFPSTSRITARVSATRQDRFTSWLPMLTPPHRDGGVGAVRVEVRGGLENQRITKVLGAVSAPSTATAIVAEVLCEMHQMNELKNKVGGVASICDSSVFLKNIKKKGIQILEFDGIPEEKN
ncbi:MAG: hypothetical protein CL431_03250 [Acidimicrobiaceae bacterium]|nr:hypothetical protein [Acidimicrobiaceae bacterium]|tara:strand:- start:11855 stop:12847 length:993 start_codon:yes stop_codon:yes gene_type:complete